MCLSTGVSVFLREEQMLLESISAWQWHSKTKPSALSEKTWALMPRFSAEISNFLKLFQSFTPMRGGQRPWNDEICTKTKRRRRPPCSLCWQSPATALLGCGDPLKPEHPCTDASPLWEAGCVPVVWQPNTVNPELLQRGVSLEGALKGTLFAELETRAAAPSVAAPLTLPVDSAVS